MGTYTDPLLTLSLSTKNPGETGLDHFSPNTVT